MRLTSENSLLLIVDLQTGLLPVIDGGAQAVNEAGWLAGMADVVGVPVWVTEQSPEKNRGQHARVTQRAGGTSGLAKAAFQRHGRA